MNVTERLNRHREAMSDRDRAVLDAKAADMNINQIATEAGLTRPTVYKILGGAVMCTWYLTGSQNPYAQAVEPGAAGAEIPDAVLEWASANGLNESDPDVYLLVALADDDPGEVIGLTGSTDAAVPGGDAERIREALAELEAERAERRSED